MDNCKPLKEQSPIEQEVKQALKNLDILAGAVTDLSSQLACVSMPPIPCGIKAETKTPAPSCELGGSLRKIADLISDQTERIREQIARLQI